MRDVNLQVEKLLASICCSLRIERLEDAFRTITASQEREFQIRVRTARAALPAAVSHPGRPFKYSVMASAFLSQFYHFPVK